jgi:hypothetical protein
VFIRHFAVRTQITRIKEVFENLRVDRYRT